MTKMMPALIFVFAFVILASAEEVHSDRMFSTTGGWGGSCQCPNGQVYSVSDRGNACQNLECVGGTMLNCTRRQGEWSKHGVVCLSRDAFAIQWRNIGKECRFYAGCSTSSCGFCGMGRCCRRAWNDDGCSATEGGETTHVCVGLPALYDTVLDPPENARTYSSSVWNDDYSGNVHARSQLHSVQAWSARVNDFNQFVIIDMGNVIFIAGVASRGRREFLQYVTRFRVEVSNDTSVWKGVGVFEASYNLVGNVFASPAQARYVKVLPTAWVYHISMRIGVIIKEKETGCNAKNSMEMCAISRDTHGEYHNDPCIWCCGYECVGSEHKCAPLGWLGQQAGWNGKGEHAGVISNCHALYDTVVDPPENARTYSSIHVGNDPKEGRGRSQLHSLQAWSAQVNDGNQFVIIDMSKLTFIAGIASQGRRDLLQYVTCYRAKVSNDTKAWKEVGEFDAGYNLVKNVFAPPAQARYVRVLPTAWDYHIAMRIGVIIMNAVHGNWSVWAPCTKTCGRGTQDRYCNNPTPLYGGDECTGCSSRGCSMHPCPIHGSWSVWEPCAKTCGRGTQVRHCNNPTPLYGGNECAGSSSQECNMHPCPIHGNWSVWEPCPNTCGHDTQVRHCNNPTPLYGGDECAGSSSQECNLDPCPIHCEWDMWSSWNNQCEGDCGLTTAKKYRFRMFKVEAKHNGNPCVGTGVESELCDFQECPLRMKCEGKVMEEAPTKKILSEGKENCHGQCRKKCTQDELCANIHSRRGQGWRDPKWTQKWYGTQFNKFVGDIALIESFSYPKMALSDAAAAAMVASCPWLIPTCMNHTHCDFGHPFARQNVTHFLDNFYRWYFSAADADGQSQLGGERSKIPAGGRKMQLDDMASPDACQRRCKIWCYEACKCNWSWEFPYSNDQGLGWRYKKPMRYRWVPSEGNSPFYGTWKCVSSRNVALAVPWDSPSWSIDLYSEAVKREAQRRFVASGSLTDRPLEYRLVCLHVRELYSRATNGGKTTAATPLNCTRAPAVVITYLHQKNMLRNEYLESSEKRKKLTSTLRKDIRKNCRRTCAEAHVPDFEVAYPNV